MIHVINGSCFYQIMVKYFTTLWLQLVAKYYDVKAKLTVTSHNDFVNVDMGHVKWMCRRSDGGVNSL